MIFCLNVRLVKKITNYNKLQSFKDNQLNTQYPIFSKFWFLIPWISTIFGKRPNLISEKWPHSIDSLDIHVRWFLFILWIFDILNTPNGIFFSWENSLPWLSNPTFYISMYSRIGEQKIFTMGYPISSTEEIRAFSGKAHF